MGDPRRPKTVSGSELTEDILEKVRRRDSHALGVLFDHHFGRIYSLAYRLMGDHATAEDVAQDVFLKVYRAAHQLDVSRDPGPWLMTITTNVCRERWRSKVGRQAKRTTSLEAAPEVADIQSKGSGGPETHAVDGDRDRLLSAALQRLPEDMRTVVVLHDLQGLTHAEIGAMIEVESAAVRKRYSRALQKLRTMLPEELL